ncbi:MAG TPA: tryptophan synthase subunit beta [Caldithrix abyssi]|uniref:Tryptophan synthase beta chain n=1 Tax=Caldithrix abyssi TaxID=187145 RepID=A0A7V4UEI0_CALAY|nr:tryptophan synthase subunit beta [Caldithrix abyssi]
MLKESKNRYFGAYGGRFIPEVLYPAFEELDAAWKKYKEDAAFHEELQRLNSSYIGRPTPLYYAENLSRHLGRAKIYFKLESLAHTGAHKINNALGQALLAKKMGKTRLIAETGAGQHGLATAAAAAKTGLECEIFMGEIDMARQQPNVFAMRLLGARVTAVSEGTRTLTDAVNAALKNWTKRIADTHYLLGSALGPHPYPDMVREFQSVIGRETKQQIWEAEGRLPDVCIACVGGGSNAIGLFSAFLDDEVELVGVEAGGHGPDSGQHAIRMSGIAKTGIVQAYKSFFLQDENGSLLPTHSVSAGLDYAGIGPQLAYLAETGRVRFTYATDEEALKAVELTARKEGIIPALESAHALAEVIKRASSLSQDALLVVNISGRGEKDLFITAPEFEKENWMNFLRAEYERLAKDGK